MSERPSRPAMTMREIREALGHKPLAPAAEQPIEVGQTYRPTEYNQARLTEDRVTVATVYDAAPGDERTIAYDIATVDYRGRPITTHSAMPESAFRKCYVLDAPEPDLLAPAAVIERALDQLDSLGAIAYVVVRPADDGTGEVHVTGATKGLPASTVREALVRAVSRHPFTVFPIPVVAPGPPKVRLDVNVDTSKMAHTIEEALAPLRAASQQLRAKAKAQLLREVAKDIEARNSNCTAIADCPPCQTRSMEAANLRAAATELEAGR
ncbi:hypothetical protein OG357_23055 [Streptomyces sp. NBC_01255]|uniref:hypothetical protein n=1 Tax=Streptomyces sp. NBC_01255 TaxID=2903798 RepID=UPI002E2EBED9|nr:hypothetical protein [Streptomyces sp. NBC_01255]